MIAIGNRAPDFELPNQDGDPIALSDFEGERLILYFYPRANSEGCSKQARSFRDTWNELTDNNIAVVGINDDPIDDLKEFERYYDLPFQLLSDETGDVARKYDSYGEKNMYGNPYLGVVRNTYVISPGGVIEYVYENVSPAGHAEEILNDIN